MQDIFCKADGCTPLDGDELKARACTFDTAIDPTYQDCISVAGILAVLASRMRPCPTCGANPPGTEQDRYRAAGAPLSSAEVGAIVDAAQRTEPPCDDCGQQPATKVTGCKHILCDACTNHHTCLS
jgi:hypothetical protein